MLRYTDVHSDPVFSTGGVSALTSNPIDVSYQGLGGATHPSDGALAVGPTHVLEIVNGLPGQTNVAIFDKSGNVLKTQPLAALLGIASTTLMSDPRAYYDPVSSRWYIIVLSLDALGGSWFHLAISQTADPTAGFCEYEKDQSKVGGVSDLAIADFPGLGMDEYALYVTTIRFYIATQTAFETQVEMIPRLGLSCTAASLSPFTWHLTEYAPDGRPLLEVQPTIAVEPSGVGYLVGTTKSGSYVGIWYITHSTSPGLFTGYVLVRPYRTPAPMPQSGTAVPLSTGDSRVTSSPIYRRGSLWFAFAAQAALSPYAASRWYEVVPTSLQVRQEGEIWNDTSGWIYPVLMPDAAGNLVMAATAVGPTIGPTPQFLSRMSSDAPNTMTASAVGFAPLGVGYRSLLAGQTTASWGDYFGIALDPDGVHVWSEGSYSLDGLSWRTAIASTHVTSAATVTGYRVSVSDASPTAGSTVTIRAQAVGATGTAVAAAGRSVTWTATGPGTFSAPVSVTDANGAATIQLQTATTISTYVVTATDSLGATGSSAPFTTVVPTTTLYLPNVTKTLGGADGWVTPFIIQNVGALPTRLDVTFYRFADGGLVVRRTIQSLAPGTSYADIPNNDADLPGNTQFSVVVRSFGSDVVSVVNEVQGTGASFEALAYTGVATGATTVYVPNVTRNFYGWDVPFIVQNVGLSTTNAVARFTSLSSPSCGTPHTFAKTLAIDPGRSGVVDPNAELVYSGSPGSGLIDGCQYSVVITSTQAVAVVANAHNETGAPAAYSHDGIAAGATVLYAPYAAVGGPDGRFSPIVVQNVGATTVGAVLEFTPLGGGPSRTLAMPSILSGSARAFDPRFSNGDTSQGLCAAPSATCLPAGEYSLRITSTGPVAAVVLPVTATTAGAYTAALAAAPKSYLPNVTRALGGAAGWTTPIIVQSVTATSVTLRWYRFADGGLVTTQNVAMTPMSAVRIDPRAVVGLVDGAQYAVVADAGSGTIAAVVDEQAAIGGDAEMIYEGFARP